MTTTITVCTTCRQDRDDPNPIRDGYRLMTALEGAAKDREDVDVRAIRCMSACDNGCAVQIAAPGRFTYVLGDLDPVKHIDDVLAFADLHAEQKSGLVPKVIRPEAIKTNVMARVAAFDLEDAPIESTDEAHARVAELTNAAE
ncbi:MAG: DUF1636 domain-containing protein [Pseudomonadota bacterium]